MPRAHRLLVASVMLLVPALGHAAGAKKPDAKKAPPKAEAPAAAESDASDADDETLAGSAKKEPASSKPSAPAPNEASASSPESKGDGKTELETADGVQACKDLSAKNDLALEAWSKLQPPVPYRYPARETIADAPWTPVLREMGHAGNLLAATFAPHLDAVLRGADPELGLSLPWSLPLGPTMACSRRQGSFDVYRYRPGRILLEPGIIVGDRRVAFFTRPAVRIMFHPTSWVFGLGGGVGSTIEMGSVEPLRASLSPELVVQLGRCCEPGYVTLAVRHDFFFAGKTDFWVASLGYTYF